jgi:DNA uptake protein ComE-like DNA-binding protein
MHQEALTRAQTRWSWLSLIPLGLGAWAPLYAGIRARRRAWCALGAAWSLITIVGWAIAIADNGNGSAGGGLIILGWVGAIASSFGIRSSYARAMGSSFEAAVEGAQAQLADRERARALAREQPELALHVGVGRPDIPGAADAGLIDLNNAPAAVLATLPGVDDSLAERIVEIRETSGGFSSVEDLGATLDLDGPRVEALRSRAVFLPRA